MNNNKKTTVDVAIAGGGMVGATLGCILAQNNISVALVEFQQPERSWDSGTNDIRVSALTRASMNIFENIGAWQKMQEEAVSPYRFMRVWDVAYNGELCFDGADVGDDVLGYIVENRVTIDALWSVFEGLSRGAIICPAKVNGLLLEKNGALLYLEDGHRIQAKLVVAADGRSSKVRELAGIGVSGWPYGQDALVATVVTERHHGETAYQRFLDEGPLAFLPLLNGASSIVWSSSSETTKKYMEMDDRSFLHALEEASGGILGAMETVGRRAAFPLIFQHTKRYIGERLALIGDAAHAMHPLAGQGVNVGLLDAAALAEEILSGQQQGRPIASRHALRNFERKRKGDNVLMLGAMDALKRIYGISHLPVGYMRSTGMNWINSSGVVKNFFTRYAMGNRGDLPRIAYGRIGKEGETAAN